MNKRRFAGISLAIILAFTSIVPWTLSTPFVNAEDIKVQRIAEKMSEYTLDEGDLEIEVIEINSFEAQYIDSQAERTEMINEVVYHKGVDEAIAARDWSQYSSDYYMNELTPDELAFLDRIDTVCTSYLESDSKDAVETEVDGQTYYLTEGIKYSDLMSKSEASSLYQWYMYNNPAYYFVCPNYFISSDESFFIDVYPIFAIGSERKEVTQQLFEQIDDWVEQVSYVEWEEDVPTETVTKPAWNEFAAVYRDIQNETGEDVTDCGLEWCDRHNCRNHCFGDGPCVSDCTSEPMYRIVYHDAEYESSTTTINYSALCTIYETELQVHDLVCNELDYVDGSYDQSVYSAVILRETVCAGYAELTSMLLNASGIDTTVVLSDSHAWNVVELNGNYYGVDNTWDDTARDNEDSPLIYEWFNVNDSNLKRYDTNDEHQSLAEYISYVPSLSSSNYNVESSDITDKDCEIGDWQSDETKHWKTGADSDDKLLEEEHIWGDGEITKFGTPTSQGEFTYTCAICGRTKVEPISKNHSGSHIPLVEYTDWYSDSDSHYRMCYCGTIIQDYSHDWDDGVVTTEATSNSQGVKTYTCLICDETKLENFDYEGKHTHYPYLRGWQYTGSAHFHTCECGEEFDTAPHDYGEWIITTEPSVGVPGEKYRECSVCGYEQTATIDALCGHQYKSVDDEEQTSSTHTFVCTTCGERWQENHTMSDWTVVSKPTSVKKGSRTRRCTVHGCLYTETEILPMVGHVHSYDTSADAWYHNDTQHWRFCNVADCREKSTPENHRWNSGTITVKPTTTTTGTRRFICLDCGLVRTETIPVHTHTKSDTMSYNTTQHWYTCTDSDCSDKIDIEDHSWDNGVITKQPTETSTGVKTFTCTVCGATKTATLEKLEHVHKAGSTWEHTSTHHYHLCSCGQTMDVAAHVWNNGVETTPATTTSTGVKTYTCTICNATRTETIPMLHSHKAQNTWYSDDDNHWQKCSCNEIMNQSTHRWDSGVITKEPTETTTGVRTYTCSVCGRTRTETVNKLEHTHRANSKYEHDNSNHWNECNCGEKMNIENHSWSKGVITKEPTEESTGEIKYTCNVCGAVKLLTLDKLEHVHKQTDGWLYDDAKHWYNCSCGEKFNVSLHDWNEGTVTKEPSVSEYGERTFVCTTCGKTRIEYIDKVVPGHEHNAKGDYVTDNSNHWKECDCGEKMNIEAHIWDDGIIVQKATYESEGITEYTCTVCGFKKLAVIDKLIKPSVEDLKEPQNLRILDLSETEVKFAWDDSDDIEIRYELEFSRNEDFNPVAASKNTTASTITMTHMKPGDTIYMRIRAVKVFDGEELMSDWVTISATTKDVEVSAPTDVKVNDVTANSAKITWTKSDDVTYVLNLYKGENTESFVKSYKANDSDFVLDDLSASTTYVVKIAAVKDVNGVDCFSDYEVIEFTTLDDTSIPPKPGDDEPDKPDKPDEPDKPDKPETPEYKIVPTDTKPTSTRVEWNVESDNYDYEIIIYTDASYTQQVAKANVDAKLVTIYNLKPETSYYLKVRAINKDGSKSEYVTCTVRTPGVYKASDNSSKSK